MLTVLRIVPASCIRAVGVCSKPISPQSLAERRASRGKTTEAGFAMPRGLPWPERSGAGPWVARNLINPCAKDSSPALAAGKLTSPKLLPAVAKGLLRSGAQIQAPGAGASCFSTLKLAIPWRLVRPSGWATQAMSRSGIPVRAQAST